ncbi:unnamed protein product, partial [Mesorhabditis spiculigera]
MEVRLFNRTIYLFILVDIDWVPAGVITEYYAMLILEVTVILLSVLVKTVALQAQLRSGSLHRNMLRLWQYATIMENAMNASQFFLILVQLKYIPTLVCWPLDLFLLSCSFLRCTMLQSRTFLLACFVGERALALYFMKDYEKKPRPWIWVFIAFAHFSATFCYGFSVHYFLFDLVATQIFMYCFLTVVLVFTGLFYHLVRLSNRLVVTVDDSMAYKEYRLSIRFQADTFCCCLHIQPRSPSTESVVKNSDHPEGDVYFDQFKNAWA